MLKLPKRATGKDILGILIESKSHDTLHQNKTGVNMQSDYKHTVIMYHTYSLLSYSHDEYHPLNPMIPFATNKVNWWKIKII